MSDIKAIVLDLDGTLLGTDKSISPRNYRAVKACFDSGLHIIVATARPPRAVRQFLNDPPFVGYVVFYNGALIKHEVKQIYRHISIPAEISRQVTDFVLLHEPDVAISYEVDDSWYCSEPLADERCVQYGIRPTDPKPEVADHDFLNTLSPTKILVLGCNGWPDVAKRFGHDVNVIGTDGGVLVQIMHRLASKEIAVKWVLEDIGVHPDETMVFGDDFNDLGLFQLCGFPIAMDNGIEELKACARFVTGSNDADGVASALEKFVL